MLDVFVCCSPGDREVAVAIAERLERAEARVALDESAAPDQSVAAAWEGGLASSAIFLLLSPESVPARLSREEWDPVLTHVTRHAEPPLGSVLVRECAYPRLLERNHFFRWSRENRETLRAIERWAISLHPAPEPPLLAPARLPWFQGRQCELDVLWDTLVDGAGTVVLFNDVPGSGKTSLAQEFARQAGAHFRDVVWVACGERSPASIAGELAAQLRLPFDGAPDDAFARLAPVIGRHRLLLVLDDVVGSLPLRLEPRGITSVLITTRSAELELPPQARVLRIDSIPPPALPLPESPVDLRLWHAMAVCRPHAAPLDLAAEIAGLSEEEASAARDRLIARRLADPFDEAGARPRLSASSLAAARASAGLEAQCRCHATTLRAAFSAWAKHPDRCRTYLAELDAALRWAESADWPLAVELSQAAFAFLRAQGRNAEGAELLERLHQTAERRQDSRMAEYCSWELSWMRDWPSGRAPLSGQQLTLDFGP